MKLMNQTLLTAEQLLIQLANVEMDMAGALAVNTALIKVKDALRPVNELRQKTIKEFTAKDKEGNPLTVADQPNMIKLIPEGITKLEELAALETETGIEPIDVMLFGKCRILPAILHDLNWLWKV